MELYPWVVVAHVFFVIVSFGAHGVSAFAMFQARTETDRGRLGATLDLSSASLVIAGIGLVLAVLLGMVAAVMGGHFGRLWPWASIAVVVVVWLAMTPLAANRMTAVREALGMPSRNDKKGDPSRQPAGDTELAVARSALKPELVATVGLVGIFVLVGLMELQPF